METQPKYQQEKSAIWQIIEQHLGILHTPGNSKNWRVTSDNRFSIFVTYSKTHPPRNTLWYDLKKEHMHDWIKYNNPYVILIANSREDIFIIPVDKLFSSILGSGLRTASDGSYKFNVRMINNSYQILQIRDFKLDEYHNNLNPFTKTSNAEQKSIKQETADYEFEELDNIDPGRSYKEGAVKRITVNSYERDPRARAVCIQVYGAACNICGFDFEKIYGEHGKGFIHVHHLRPLADIAEEYELDPINDLRPVCPNCHAMIHRKNKLHSIEEIQALIKQTNV